MGSFDNQGLALGEVYGFRWWNWSGARLTGMYGSWSPGANVAGCNYHDHVAPDEDCNCGMWAYWRQEVAPIPSGRRVAGVVKGWGDTLIGDQGCRCQMAQIVALSFERISQVPHQYTEVTGTSGPPPGVRWGQPEGAMKTYLAFGGTPAYTPVHRVVTDYQDDLAKQAADEVALASQYGVPVYTTIQAMLTMHPLTKDYLPPEPTEADWAELQATLSKGVQAMSDAIQALIPHLISGTDALKQLNARIDVTPDLLDDLAAQAQSGDDPPPWPPLIGA